MTKLEDRAFLIFVVCVSAAMAWIASPFFGAILWGLVTAIVFAPVNDRLVRRMPTRKNTAAGLTLLLIIAIVIIPFVLIGSLLVDEALSTYQNLRAHQIDFGQTAMEIERRLPAPLLEWADRMGFGDMQAVQERLSAFVGSGLQLVTAQAITIGQGAFSFVVSMGIMLYLTYFLLRDGRKLSRQVGDAVPMSPERRGELFQKFITVIRATIKGSIVVAIVQGVLGGLVFWALGIHAPLLWGVTMGLLSLVPAIGTGLVWVPVAIYLLATGSIWQGVVLVFCGFVVIGMVDNVLRPILVGKDTRMPDYVVLITTLGGISVMGINGFIVGPVVAALFIAAWGIFSDARSPDAASAAKSTTP